MTSTDLRFPKAAALAARERASVRSTPPDTTPIRASTAKGNYAGLELQPYQGRPGAMDAYALPSLMNGVKVARRMGCGV